VWILWPQTSWFNFASLAAVSPTALSSSSKRWVFVIDGMCRVLARAHLANVPGKFREYSRHGGRERGEGKERARETELWNSCIVCCFESICRKMGKRHAWNYHEPALPRLVEFSLKRHTSSIGRRPPIRGAAAICRIFRATMCNFDPHSCSRRAELRARCTQSLRGGVKILRGEARFQLGAARCTNVTAIRCVERWWTVVENINISTAVVIAHHPWSGLIYPPIRAPQPRMPWRSDSSSMVSCSRECVVCTSSMMPKTDAQRSHSKKTNFITQCEVFGSRGEPPAQ